MLGFLNKHGPFVRQYVVAILATMTTVNVTMNLKWPSPVLVKLLDPINPVFDQPITQMQASWIVSSTFLSGFIFNFVAAFSVDRLGRINCLKLTILPRIACYLLMIFANSFWMIVFGRVLGGLCDAFTSTIVPMYTAEISSKEIRGSTGIIQYIFAGIGTVIMLSTGPFVSYTTVNIIALSVQLVTAVPLFFLPDSPYYLYSQGKTQSSLKVLTFLQGSESAAEKEIEDYHAAKIDNQTSYSEIFQSIKLWKSFGLTVALTLGSQLVGYSVVAFYLQTILDLTDADVSSEIASVLIGLVELFAAVCTTIFIDRFGRKPIAVGTTLGITVGMVGLGTFFYFQESGREIVGFLNYLPILSMVFVCYFYIAGLGSVQWPIVSELYEGRTRSWGMCLAGSSTVFTIFLLTTFFADLTIAVGAAAVYWSFAGFGILLSLFVIFVVPETKGKTFLEIQSVL